MTNSGPPSAESSFTACDVGSVPSDPLGVPRLIDTMSAPCALAHSMPAIEYDSSPVPSLPSTLPTRRRAPGAAPFSLAPEAAPVPAMVEAVCVPWPLPSSTLWPGTKLAVASTCPTRSGWSRSAPVSSTATLTPVPSRPCCHASVALICAVSVASEASTLPSSHSLPMPPDRDFGSEPGAMPFQNDVARPLSARSAFAWIEESVRTDSASLGVAGAFAVRAAAGAVAITGTVSVCASS